VEAHIGQHYLLANRAGCGEGAIFSVFRIFCIDTNPNANPK